MNTTDLFNDANNCWSASSESFWTTLFGFFVLHLGSMDTPSKHLTVWHCTDGTDNKWYASRRSAPSLELSNISFESIAIEPLTLSSKPWPGTQLFLSPADGGFSPDIVIKTRKAEGGDHFVIIENKVREDLQANQMVNYRCLTNWLFGKNISFDFLLLQSLGSSPKLFEQARCFQNEGNKQFGILLWEEVLRLMQSTHFAQQGLPIQSWQVYTEALDSDCVQE